MNEEQARLILGEAIQLDNKIAGQPYMAWEPDAENITLDGEYTLDEIEALAWWMRNKKV